MAIYEKWNADKTKLLNTEKTDDAFKISKLVANGYLLVVEPVIDPAIQKKGDKTFTSTERSWSVVDKSQEELDSDLLVKRQGMVLTPCQFLDGLEAAGKLDEAKVIVASAPYQVKNKFNRATQYERTHAMINQFGAVLWPVDTDAELDNFFTTYMKLD